QKNCQECHRPGQIGPMPLIRYEDAEGNSAMIREVIVDKRMPPWYADPKIGHFKGDRRLPEEEAKTLVAWIDQGCPKGDAKDMPLPRDFPEGWKIGKPDIILTMKPYDVPAENPRGGIPYKYFWVDTNFKEDMWFERAEAKPGATEVVHHIIAFVVPGRDSDEVVPPGPPLLPPFIPEGRKATVLCGTAPGDMPLILPPGCARKIPKGSRILFQMHYTPNGKAQSDASSIGLIFCKKPPEYRVLSLAVFSFPLKIPAGDPNYRVECDGPLDLESGKVGFDEPARVLGFMPHMHLRGKDFYIEALWPNGKTEPLLSVPRFNFSWQNMYRLAEPLELPVGSKIRCVAHFDNSADNRNNPDPTKTVFWGDQTWQEMMIGWTDVAFKVKK
ncbi:MAG TPA: cytochrome c, partial [Gemmataceae bacterium]|nr:cytochrome c [Gemmataceae bacterium]